MDAEAGLVIFEFARLRKKNQHTNKILAAEFGRNSSFALVFA